MKYSVKPATVAQLRPSYPCLMQLTTDPDIRVLFTAPNTGMKLTSLGFQQSENDWGGPEWWIPFVGTITVGV